MGGCRSVSIVMIVWFVMSNSCIILIGGIDPSRSSEGYSTGYSQNGPDWLRLGYLRAG